MPDHPMRPSPIGKSQAYPTSLRETFIVELESRQFFAIRGNSRVGVRYPTID